MGTIDRTFVFAVVAAFVVSFILGFVFHGVLLAPDYSALLAVYRAPGSRPELFPLLLLAMLITAIGMTAIYRYGREERPFLAQGLRFGLLIALASVIPLYLIGYVVTNIPTGLAIKQIVLETVRITAMAVVIAWLHRTA